MNTENILSGFQEFFLQSIIKDRSNKPFSITILPCYLLIDGLRSIVLHMWKSRKFLFWKKDNSIMHNVGIVYLYFMSLSMLARRNTSCGHATLGYNISDMVYDKGGNLVIAMITSIFVDSRLHFFLHHLSFSNRYPQH